MHPRLALTLGDPHGIGPEIALKALARLRPEQRARITVYGPWAALQAIAPICGLQDLLPSLAHQECGSLPQAPRWGEVCAPGGRSAVDSAAAALQDAKRGLVDAVIACPHHETAIAQAGITFSGYPSLVAQVCGVAQDEVFLMLVGAGLRIVHVTLHESVTTALSRLTPELVVRAAHAGLQACERLGCEQPRMAVFGINPHASENGLFGQEDQRITEPAVQQLRSQGWQVDGPAGADVLLAQRTHDVYLAMLHDQGHIPIKLLAPHAASALSIGAGLLLSSVGHGSAMDIAGRGVASEEAVLRTIALLSGAKGLDA